jgi:hypothetical protein
MPGAQMAELVGDDEVAPLGVVAARVEQIGESPTARL